MPSQVLVQALHWVHASNWQSMSPAHGTPWLHGATSREKPSAGLPHSFASCSIRRCRYRKPPVQEAEQGDHSCQCPQAPSRQLLAAQSCVLHGSISSLWTAEQRPPPPWGVCAMCRLRVRWPPPQEQVQPLQDDQSPHRQLTSPHPGMDPPPLSRQARVSDRMKLQGRPPPCDDLAIWRSRCCWPAPHSTEQAPHSVQAVASQSVDPQEELPHARSSRSEVGHGRPPSIG